MSYSRPYVTVRMCWTPTSTFTWKEGKLILLAVLVLAVVGMSEASKRFSQAGRSADLLRLRLEDCGSVLQQTIRRAA